MNAPMNGLPSLSEAQSIELDWALTRFYVAKGLSDVDIDGDLLVPLVTTADDRATHADVLSAGYICDSDIVEFMHRVSGLPRPLCATWNYLDNVEMFRQGAMPECALMDCYIGTIEVVQGATPT